MDYYRDDYRKENYWNFQHGKYRSKHRDYYEDAYEDRYIDNCRNTYKIETSTGMIALTTVIEEGLEKNIAYKIQGKLVTIQSLNDLTKS